MYWDGRSCRSHPSWLDLGHSTNKEIKKEINIKTAGVEFKKGMYYPRFIIKLTTAPTGFVATYTCADWPKGIFGQDYNGTYRPGVTMKIKGLCHCAAHVIRLELHAGGFFGDPSTVQFEEAVQKAWCQFKQWKRTNKISCSQPSFKASHVDRLVYIHFSFCSTNMIWKCSEVIALKFYWDWTTCVWGCEPHPRGDYKRGSTLELEGL